jgi:3'-phosphoadenosine 5'-phosphosulfate sulfotransferase (PAPS reductase)/FAD synthetase
MEMMSKKLQELLKRNSMNNPTIMQESYGSRVNSGIVRKYKFGEEHAIIRKALNNVIVELQKLGVDTSQFKEFKEYYNYVENLKTQYKTE